MKAPAEGWYTSTSAGARDNAFVASLLSKAETQVKSSQLCLGWDSRIGSKANSH